MLEQTGMRPAVAVTENKLVCKVASRVIHPVGLIQIPTDMEAAFLAHQDIGLLPGMGSGLLRTAAVTRFRVIRELVWLNDGEALVLFGKRRSLVRDMAREIGVNPVASKCFTDTCYAKAPLSPMLMPCPALRSRGYALTGILGGL
jgi:DNA polymerase-4